ncbi:Homeobox protein DBX1 [Fasciola gigantica]|uniref:Homeobox protein DBX1 n=1 Tax=Fasciola gigantica TaxID=46835 RepID=A0A504YJ78_FASGI|nr:Homeobox protein DBX1 [Fasciola gigantica]
MSYKKPSLNFSVSSLLGERQGEIKDGAELADVTLGILIQPEKRVTCLRQLSDKLVENGHQHSTYGRNDPRMPVNSIPSYAYPITMNSVTNAPVETNCSPNQVIRADPRHSPSVPPTWYNVFGQGQLPSNPFITDKIDTGELRRLTEFLYHELSNTSQQVVWPGQSPCPGVHNFSALGKQTIGTSPHYPLLSFPVDDGRYKDSGSNHTTSVRTTDSFRCYGSISGLLLHSLPRCTRTVQRGPTSRGTLRRAVFTDFQRQGLESAFSQHAYIAKPDRKALAEQLGLKDAQVKIWFQNRRMKWRSLQQRSLSTNVSEIGPTSELDRALTKQPSKFSSTDVLRESTEKAVEVKSVPDGFRPQNPPTVPLALPTTTTENVCNGKNIQSSPTQTTVSQPDLDELGMVGCANTPHTITYSIGVQSDLHLSTLKEHAPMLEDVSDSNNPWPRPYGTFQFLNHFV